MWPKYERFGQNMRNEAINSDASKTLSLLKIAIDNNEIKYVTLRKFKRKKYSENLKTLIRLFSSEEKGCTNQN